jgi:hypothetical protein
VINLKSPNGQSELHILNFGTFLQHANHIHNSEEFFYVFLMSGRYWIQEETAAIPFSELKSVTGEFT